MSWAPCPSGLVIVRDVAIHRAFEERERPTEHKIRDDRSSEEIHFLGGLAESATSIIYGRPWIGKLQSRESHEAKERFPADVMGANVRAVESEHLNLLGHDWDNPLVPSVLWLVQPIGPASNWLTVDRWQVRPLGWFPNFQMKQPRYWRRDMPEPCYVVPRQHLYPMDSLPTLAQLARLSRPWWLEVPSGRTSVFYDEATGTTSSDWALWSR